MPNGKTHDIISLVTAPAIGIGAWYMTKNVETASVILGCYLFASFFFNGDLDTNSAPYNRWFVFKMVWIPYQLMFNHRSIFTHGIVIGTVIRIVYLGIVPFLILYFGKDINILTYFSKETVMFVLIGLELGNTVHTVSDKIF